MTQAQMETLTVLIKEGWISHENLNIKNLPIGGPVTLTKDGKELQVMPDGSTIEPSEGKSSLEH